MRRFSILLYLAAVLCLTTTCCDDCEDCPVCPEPEDTQYRLYAVDDNGHRLYAIDIPADTVIFSVPVDYTVRSMLVSQDGSRLMVGAIEELTTLVYDTRDLSVIDTLDNMLGYYYCDYSDDYIVLASTLSADLDVKILDPVNLVPRIIVEKELRTSFLDTVSNCLYGVAASEYNLIYKIDCNTGQLVDSFFMTTNGGQLTLVSHIAYNWLNDILYIHAKISPWQGCFYQYDLHADSALDSTYMVDQYGSSAISPDGRKVYMTEGGDGWHGIVPPGYIRIYDAFTHEVTDSIFHPDVNPYGNPWLPFYRDILITPDGKRAYIAAGGNDAAGASLPLFSIDLEQNTIKVGAMPTSRFAASVIATGPVPSQNKEE